MKANYFKYKQRAILQALNHIAKYANGLSGEITFNEVELDFLQPKEEETPAIFSKKKFESYTDYPEGARNNARRAIEWKEKNGSDCGTQVGWTRARQLADGKPISEETISRMSSFERHRQYSDVPYSEGCGGIMWDAWGGDSGIRWASNKLKEIRKEKNSEQNESEEINVVELFEMSGKKRPENCLMSKSLPAEFDADEEREKFLNDFKKESFAELSAIENQVLAMLGDGNDYNSIRKALNINAFKLSKIFRRFKSLELIDSKANITNKGMIEVARQDVTKIEIFYSYDKSPEVDGPSILPNDRTRDFCKALVNFSNTRVWSREDINGISARIGYNSFRYRGGWYHNPKTDRNQPYCRHVWKQEIFFT